MSCPPTDSAPSLLPFSPAAERTLTVFGGTVELALLPQRAQRLPEGAGRRAAARPALLPCRADQIVAKEAYWRHGDLAVTPNLYPFAREQRILWMAKPAREPDFDFWCAAHDWLERANGTLLLNNIGAAASIARAHAHLIGERLHWLQNRPDRTPQRETPPPIELPAGVDLVFKELPFLVLGVRGPARARAEAMMRLADARLTATWNVIADRDTTWAVPRRVEVPAPNFPEPLGAAELWGRWCYLDPAAFEAADGAMLERALMQATTPALA
ncbi:MAG: hypothetical protein AB8H80_01515 [Planctomycetota bacterium]